MKERKKERENERKKEREEIHKYGKGETERRK